jgi:hypothetical protein
VTGKISGRRPDTVAATPDALFRMRTKERDDRHTVRSKKEEIKESTLPKKVIRGAAPVEKAGEDAVLAVLSTGGNRKE